MSNYIEMVMGGQTTILLKHLLRMVRNLIVKTIVSRIFIRTGEIVVFIARGVGLLVAIVAIVSSILIMMILRSVIALLMYKWGVSGVSIIILSSIYATMKLSNMSPKILWTMISQSCS